MLLWVSSPCLLHIHLEEVQDNWPSSLKMPPHVLSPYRPGIEREEKFTCSHDVIPEDRDPETAVHQHQM